MPNRKRRRSDRTSSGQRNASRLASRRNQRDASRRTGSWSERRLVFRRNASHQRFPIFCHHQTIPTTPSAAAAIVRSRETSQGCLNQSRTAVILVSVHSWTVRHLVWKNCFVVETSSACESLSKLTIRRYQKIFKLSSLATQLLSRATASAPKLLGSFSRLDSCQFPSVGSNRIHELGRGYEN